MTIDYTLPVRIYKVGDTCFSTANIRAMIGRTNSKLEAAGIHIEIESISSVPDKSLAYVYKEIDIGYNNHVKLMTDYGSGANKLLRVFLVKVDFDCRNDSWTNDPVEIKSDEDVWGGAIFMTELLNDNSDERYQDMGYLPSNDSLLHEIGHVLMQEADHYDGLLQNFFHEEAELTDDTMFQDQINRMRDLSKLGPKRYLKRI